MRSSILTTTVCLFGITTTILNADTIAYVVPSGTIANQFLPGNEPQTLGLDFNVNSGIYVTSLGVFDSGSDGLSSVLTAHLFDRTTGLSLADLTFTPNQPGTLIGGSRFLTLETALFLPAGFQGVIAVDYLSANNEGNGNRRASTGNWSTDDGGGLLSFVGSGRIGYSNGGTAVYPTVIDSSPFPDVYASGTFTYVAVPEPSTVALLIGGLGGMAVMMRRRQKR